MKNNLQLELYNSQEKLRLIHKLSNTIQEAKTVSAKNDIAYAIHQIIELDTVSSDTYNMVAVIQLQHADFINKV